MAGDSRYLGFGAFRQREPRYSSAPQREVRFGSEADTQWVD
jgi:hypothetical protein